MYCRNCGSEMNQNAVYRQAPETPIVRTAEKKQHLLQLYV